MRQAKLIRDIVGIQDERVHVCKVLSVDGATCNVEPISGHAELHGVRLNCVTSSTAGLIITPAVNSEVIVHQISKVDSYVAQFSEIEKIEAQIGSFKFSLNGSEMVFNDGTNGGLIIISKLQTEIAKINASIATLKQATQTGLAAMDGLVPGTSAVFIASTASMQQADLSDVTNGKIKH